MKRLKNMVLGTALVGILAGCSGERAPPTPNEIDCMGLTRGRESFGSSNGARMADIDCNGSIDLIQDLPGGDLGSYILMVSPQVLDDYFVRFHQRGAVIMTPEMQEIADSIYSLQKRLYFLEDSVRYWANETGDTTNLRGSMFVKHKEQGRR